MNRRDMLTALLALAAANNPALVLAQTSSSPRWRVGVLYSARKTRDGKCPLGAKRYTVTGNLENFGLVEGKDYVVIGYCDDGQPERLPELARKLVIDKVDAIVADEQEAIAAAREATDRIPIVMLYGPDPVARGWARSFARPGGNLTGSTWELDETDSFLLKGYELIQETIPSVKRIVHLEGAAHTPTLVSAYNEARKKAASRLGVSIQVVGIPNGDGIEDTFRKIRAMKADAISLHIDALVRAHIDRIMEEIVRSQIPTQVWWPPVFLTERPGALLTFVTDNEDHVPRAAEYVAKILRGTKPGDLPIVRPTRTTLGVDLRVARRLGITIPRSVLVRADTVIE